MNTVYEGEHRSILTYKHTVTNTITAPDDYLSLLQPSEPATVIYDTNMYYSTVPLTQVITDGDATRLIRTSDVLTQMVITESMPSRMASVMTSYIAFDVDDRERNQQTNGLVTTDVVKTYFVTYTYFNTYLENGSTNVQTNVSTSSDLVTEKLYLYPTSKKPMTDAEATTTTKIGKTVNPIRIFATKTYLTTFTYFTTMLQQQLGNAENPDDTSPPETIIDSHTRVVENIITESIPNNYFPSEAISGLRTSLRQPENHGGIVTVATLIGGQALEITAVPSLSASPSNGISFVAASSSAIANIESSTAEGTVEQTTIQSDEQQKESIQKEPLTDHQNVGAVESPVSDLIGSLSLNAFRPVLNAMAGLIQNNFGGGNTRPVHTATKTSKANEEQRIIPNETGVRSRIVNKTFAENQILDTQNTVEFSDRGPIYIPVGGIVDEGIESAESQNIERSNFNAFSPPTSPGQKQQHPSIQQRHKDGKTTYESPLLNGGIPISPGEIITANSDVIIGRPSGIIGGPRLPPFNGGAGGSENEIPIGMIPPAPAFLKDKILANHPADSMAVPSVQSEAYIGPPPPPPPSPTPSQQQQQSSHVTRNPSGSKNLLNYNRPNFISIHQTRDDEPQKSYSKHHGPSYYHQKLYQDYRNHVNSPQNRPAYHVPHKQQQQLHFKVPPSIRPAKEEIIEIQRIPEVFSTDLPPVHIINHQPVLSLLDSAHFIATQSLENHRQTVGSSQSGHFTDIVQQSTINPLLVNIQPSHVANVLIPYGSTTALIYGGTNEPHKNGHYFDEPSPYLHNNEFSIGFSSYIATEFDASKAHRPQTINVAVPINHQSGHIQIAPNKPIRLNHPTTFVDTLRRPSSDRSNTNDIHVNYIYHQQYHPVQHEIVDIRPPPPTTETSFIQFRNHSTKKIVDNDIIYNLSPSDFRHHQTIRVPKPLPEPPTNQNPDDFIQTAFAPEGPAHFDTDPVEHSQAPSIKDIIVDQHKDDDLENEEGEVIQESNSVPLVTDGQIHSPHDTRKPLADFNSELKNVTTKITIATSSPTTTRFPVPSRDSDLQHQQTESNSLKYWETTKSSTAQPISNVIHHQRLKPLKPYRPIPLAPSAVLINELRPIRHQQRPQQTHKIRPIPIYANVDHVHSPVNVPRPVEEHSNRRPSPMVALEPPPLPPPKKRPISKPINPLLDGAIAHINHLESTLPVNSVRVIDNSISVGQTEKPFDSSYIRTGSPSTTTITTTTTTTTTTARSPLNNSESTSEETLSTIELTLNTGEVTTKASSEEVIEADKDIDRDVTDIFDIKETNNPHNFDEIPSSNMIPDLDIDMKPPPIGKYPSSPHRHTHPHRVTEDVMGLSPPPIPFVDMLEFATTSQRSTTVTTSHSPLRNVTNKYPTPPYRYRTRPTTEFVSSADRGTRPPYRQVTRVPPTVTAAATTTTEIAPTSPRNTKRVPIPIPVNLDIRPTPIHISESNRSISSINGSASADMSAQHNKIDPYRQYTLLTNRQSFTNDVLILGSEQSIPEDTTSSGNRHQTETIRDTSTHSIDTTLTGYETTLQSRTLAQTHSDAKTVPNKIRSIERSTVILPTKYITNTKTLTVTTTKTTVIRSQGITTTLTLTLTKTSTILDTVTHEVTHTLVQPTHILIEPTSTSTPATTTTTSIPSLDQSPSYPDYPAFPLHPNPSAANDFPSSGATFTVEESNNDVPLDEFIINYDHGIDKIPSTQQKQHPVRTPAKENDSIFVVMTDQKHTGIIHLNSSLIDTPAKINAMDNNDDDTSNAINQNDGPDLPARDEDDMSGEVNHVLLGGILIASPPRHETPKIFMSNECRPDCKPTRNELCQRVDGQMRCVCRPGFARMFPDRPCKRKLYPLTIFFSKINF